MFIALKIYERRKAADLNRSTFEFVNIDNIIRIVPADDFTDREINLLPVKVYFTDGSIVKYGINTNQVLPTLPEKGEYKNLQLPW